MSISKKRIQVSESEKEYPLLNIDIQISEKESTVLTIFPKDVIEDKVIEFCRKYKLTAPMISELRHQDINELEKKIAERNI